MNDQHRGLLMFGSVVVALFGVMTTSALTFLQVQDRSRAAAADCQTRVDAREDGRAVWLYLIDRTDDPESERVIEFKAFLDDRLPPLECNADHIPVLRD